MMLKTNWVFAQKAAWAISLLHQYKPYCISLCSLRAATDVANYTCLWESILQDRPIAPPSRASDITPHKIII